MRLTVPDMGSIAREASLVAFTLTEICHSVIHARVDHFAGTDGRTVLGHLGTDRATLYLEPLR
jgi:hypothetical protein